MIKNLLRKNQINENPVDVKVAGTEDVVNTGVKKKIIKRRLLSVLLFLLLAVIGFGGMTLVATDNSSGKKIQNSCRQLPRMQPLSQAPPSSAALHMQQVPVQNAEVEKQKTERTTHSAAGAAQKVEDLTHNARRTTRNAEERDVFKEFYIGHEGQGAKGLKVSAMHLEQNLPDLANLPKGNSGSQSLPPMQTLNTVPLNEQPMEVKIYGITCISEAGLFGDKCVAITSEGVLRKGDQFGSETVFAVNKTSFATSKRTVEFN